jgi:hypothetical protein
MTMGSCRTALLDFYGSEDLMTDWTNIPNGNIETGKPGRAIDGRALRDNPIAIAEGADGAPRIAFAALDAWFTTAGAVGTYVFARRLTGDAGFGSMVAGSTLRPISSAYSVQATGGTAQPAFSDGGALSGTWRCMGNFDEAVTGSDESGSISLRGATLWLRIS